MPLICTICAKEPHLKALIELDGEEGICDICEEKEVVLSSLSNRFFQLCKALIRFNFSEWDYNHHWGGDGLESLFYGDENLFFNESRAVSKDIYEELTNEISQGEVYEDYNKGVTIFAGYFDGQQNGLLRSIRTSHDPKLLSISKRLLTENHFNLEDELRNILLGFGDVTTTTLQAGQVLYRARTGYTARKSRLDVGFETEYHYGPYIGDDIGAPPPSIASAGRANRTGVSFLYCATNEQTAIAEIRPHPGDRVSVGGFQLKREMKAYDLSQSHLLHYFATDELLDTYVVLNTLRILMNKTITPAERSQYSITQLIADCIRQLGYDAVMFASTVGTGTNTVVFNSADAEHIDASAKVYLIDKVEYTSSSEKIVNIDQDYAEDILSITNK